MNMCKNMSWSLLVLVIVVLLVVCGGSENKVLVFSQSSFVVMVLEDELVIGILLVLDLDSNDMLNFILVLVVFNGVFELNGNGSYIYMLNGDFFGEDSVIVMVLDGKLLDIVMVIFMVMNVNDVFVVGISQVIVSSQGIIKGLIEIIDVDGDDIIIIVIMVL